MYNVKQVEKMKKCKNFVAFCRVLVEKHGNYTTKDIENCGLSFEYFLRFSNCNSEKLYNSAKMLLKLMEG